jgi:hypothetical protein
MGFINCLALRQGENKPKIRNLPSNGLFYFIAFLYLCIFIFMSMHSHCMFIYLHSASRHSSATLTEVFPCFFLRCTANSRVKPAKIGARPALNFQYFCVVICIVYFVSFCVLFVCNCVLNYCHPVATQLQLRNISYHITSSVVRQLSWSFLRVKYACEVWVIAG